MLHSDNILIEGIQKRFAKQVCLIGQRIQITMNAVQPLNINHSTKFPKVALTWEQWANASS